MHRTHPTFLALLAGGGLSLAACRQLPPPMLAVPNLGGGVGGIALRAAPVDVPLPTGRPRLVNTRWLFGDEFFPPGARRIFPAKEVKLALRETPQTKYPSMESLVSPDGMLTMFSDSGATKNVMVHWLMVYRKGDAQPTSLFHTRNTYEVLWSADSAHAAITEFIGDNRSEVVVGDMSDYSRVGPLDVRAAVGPYFTFPQIEAPRFLRAQAFGEGAWLLVRGVGRLAEAPFDQIGYEVLVDVRHLGDPDAMVFVRGYVLPGHEVDN